MNNLKRLTTCALAASALAVASIGASAPSQARDRGGAIAAGVIGGLALGAIAGSAAGAAPAYGYDNGYGAYAPPAYGGDCYMTRQATYDPYGNFAGYRRVRVCE